MMVGSNSREQLKSIIERVERLNEDKQAIQNDIKEIFEEAKGNGFDVKALRAIIKMRAEDAEKREAHEALVETYMHALGMLADLPLGQSAIERATA
jgi:uncharacterized protein (UPF0335 family)